MHRSSNKKAIDCEVPLNIFRKIFILWIDSWGRSTNVCEKMQNKSSYGSINPVFYSSCDHPYCHRHCFLIHFMDLWYLCNIIAEFKSFIIITYQWQASTFKSFQSPTASRKYWLISPDRSSESNRATLSSSQLFISKILRRAIRTRVAIEWLREFLAGTTDNYKEMLKKWQEGHRISQIKSNKYHFF